ncbi:hypothetical protein DQE82_25345 [Micromonospora sp. LHW51205]|nr:hypothetical protein DQE82_25345 [Micromonospora sp. LHW51205]
MEVESRRPLIRRLCYVRPLMEEVVRAAIYGLDHFANAVSRTSSPGRSGNSYMSEPLAARKSMVIIGAGLQLAPK